MDSVTSEQASLSWLPSAFDGNRPVLQYIILQRNRSDIDDAADFVLATIQPVNALTMDNGRVSYNVSQSGKQTHMHTCTHAHMHALIT